MIDVCTRSKTPHLEQTKMNRNANSAKVRFLAKTLSMKKDLKLSVRLLDSIQTNSYPIISSYIPLFRIIKLLLLLIPDGRVTSTFVDRVDEARWPGTKGFRKLPPKAERPSTLLEIRIGWRNLLLGHPWRSHTC